MNLRDHTSALGLPFALAALAMLSSIGANARTLIVDGSDISRGNHFASLSEATKALRAGDTLLIGTGIYRDAIDLRTAKHLSDRTAGDRTDIKIEAMRNARPIIKGSDVVRDWTRVAPNVFAKRDWPHNSQQVFIDGTPLQQIGGVIYVDFPLNAKHPLARLHQSQGGIWPGRRGNTKDDLTDDSFFYDQSAQVLYIRTQADPNRALVEVSTRPYLVYGEKVNNVELRGIAFAHANTTAISQSGAITLIGDHVTLDGLNIQHVDGAGLDITGNDNAVLNSHANYCGNVGMKVRGQRTRVIGNETNFNNTRGFNKWWEAGGAKFVGAGGLQNSEVAQHKAFRNNGDGLWFDWHNNNNQVHGNIVAYNQGIGIHYEASRKAFIYDNYVVGNTQRGIYLPNSGDSVIAHNLVAANDMEGLAIVDERRAGSTDEQLATNGNRVVANVFAWNKKAALVMPLDGRDNESDSNVFVDVDSPQLALGWPSREHPLVRNLEQWRAQSGFDQQSRWTRAPRTEAIEAQLKERAPMSDKERQAWTQLLLSVNSLRAPRIAGIESHITRPGAAVGPSP